MAEYKIIEETRQPARCLECGEKMYGGRADRKFCNGWCKNQYNNHKTQAFRNLRMRIRTTLNRNYDILSKLLREKVISIDCTELKLLGFDPDFVTSHHKVNRHDRCCCYDISYIRTEGRIYQIQRLDAGRVNLNNDG